MNRHKESTALQAYRLRATWHSMDQDGLSQQACHGGSLKFGLPHLAVGLQHIRPQIGDNASGVRLWQCTPCKTDYGRFEGWGDGGEAGRGIGNTAWLVAFASGCHGIPAPTTQCPPTLTNPNKALEYSVPPSFFLR